MSRRAKRRLSNYLIKNEAKYKFFRIKMWILKQCFNALVWRCNLSSTVISLSEDVVWKEKKRFVRLTSHLDLTAVFNQSKWFVACLTIVSIPDNDAGKTHWNDLKLNHLELKWHFLTPRWEMSNNYWEEPRLISIRKMCRFNFYVR